VGVNTAKETLDGEGAEFLPVANEAVAAMKDSIAGEAEKAVDETAAKSERPQDVPQQAAPSSAAHEASRDGSPLPQSPASLTSHSATTTGSEHSSQRARTHSEHLVATLPQLPPPAALQRMDVVLRGTDQVVRLDIRQSQGSLRVAVHSDDAALAVRLRDSLPELLNRLDDRGLQARVMSLGSQSTVLSPARMERGDAAGKDADGSSRDMTRQQQQQKERNPQRTWRAATWKLHEE
jgi:hypothetical protein